MERRRIIIEVTYDTGKVEKLCTDYEKAKKKLGDKVAEALHALINLLKSADNLLEIQQLGLYHLHILSNNRRGQYALDISGRKDGYRLIITPVRQEGVDDVFKNIKEIIILEVSNHYA